MSGVYLDYHATTPVDERVLDAMLPYFRREFGNAASSTHQWGWRARDAVEQARRDVAALINATPREIIFTSGATESNNWALRGAAALAPAGRRHLVVSAVEHKSVLEVAHSLERDGWRLTIAPVTRDGRVDLAALAAALTPDTAVVSVMAANNEIGTVQPLAEIAAFAHAAGALLHVDAAQAVGKIPVDVAAPGVDLLSLTAHKIYGVSVNGTMTSRLPNNLHVSFADVDGESLMLGIGDIAVSSGSACTSASGQPSHVLSAIYGAQPVPSASIRFGLGRFTTEAEIDTAADRFVAVVRHLREMAPA